MVKRSNPDQLLLRLPAGMRDRIQARADAMGRSLSAEIVRVLDREFPEPFSIEAKLIETITYLHELEGSVDHEHLDKLRDTIDDTLRGIATGRIEGVSERSREIARDRLIDRARGEAELEHLFNTDGMSEEEIRAYELRREFEKR